MDTIPQIPSELLSQIMRNNNLQMFVSPVVVQTNGPTLPTSMIAARTAGTAGTAPTAAPVASHASHASHDTHMEVESAVELEAGTGSRNRANGGTNNQNAVVSASTSNPMVDALQHQQQQPHPQHMHLQQPQPQQQQQQQQQPPSHPRQQLQQTDFGMNNTANNESVPSKLSFIDYGTTDFAKNNDETTNRKDEDQPIVPTQNKSNHSHSHSHSRSKQGREEKIKMSSELDKCLNLVTEFMNRPEAEPFNAPVNWKALNLTDYPKIIKAPMDLGTIRAKLENNEYANAYELAVDVRLVFTNAKIYNQPGSGIYIVAENLHKQFERRFPRICRSANKHQKTTNKIRGRPSTFDQRQKFVQLLTSLSNDNIGRIIELIDKLCPIALNDMENCEELEIEVYHMDYDSIEKVTQFAEKQIKKSRNRS